MNLKGYEQIPMCSMINYYKNSTKVARGIYYQYALTVVKAT